MEQTRSVDVHNGSVYVLFSISSSMKQSPSIVIEKNVMICITHKLSVFSSFLVLRCQFRNVSRTNGIFSHVALALRSFLLKVEPIRATSHRSSVQGQSKFSCKILKRVQKSLLSYLLPILRHYNYHTNKFSYRLVL